ncbi:hypothetical protein BY458DRAFT_141599 [Sporodiniella umbellata]|nr:hypothetical protein BY458DRAFT_141599 [Sporodiniella umbellata]
MALFKRSVQTVFCRSLHSQEWTREALSKIKRTELSRIAKEHNLELLAGSKNDWIDQMLTSKEIDTQWVDAFENKVAHRGHSASRNKKTMVKGPHPLNEAFFKKIAQSPRPTEVYEPEKPKKTIEMDNDVHKEWVEAFEMKVSSRGSRSQRYREAWTPTTLHSNTKAQTQTETSTERPALNMAIGSSLLLWYIGGQEVFIKIWEFVS